MSTTNDYTTNVGSIIDYYGQTGVLPGSMPAQDPRRIFMPGQISTISAGKRSITLKKDEVCKLVEDYLNEHVLKNTVRVKRVLENHDEFRVEFDELLDELAGEAK